MKKGMQFAVMGVLLFSLSGIAMAFDVQWIIPQYFNLPIKITHPGSYKLMGNITVPNANTTAIKVTADNVTIDLNGFSILGPTVCTGTGATLMCSPTGTGDGINAPGTNNLKVTNGNIQGMGHFGILTENASVEGVRVNSNGGGGIFYPKMIKDCTADKNGGVGGLGVLFGIVSDSVSNFNKGDGIVVGFGGKVSGNVVVGNGGYGLNLATPVGYVNNVLVENDVNGGQELPCNFPSSLPSCP